MKVTTIALFLFQCIVGVVLLTWHLLLLFIEIFGNGDDDSTVDDGIGHHMTMGDNALEDDGDIIKRSGEQYISENTTAPYEQGPRT